MPLGQVDKDKDWSRQQRPGGCQDKLDGVVEPKPVEHNSPPMESRTPQPSGIQASSPRCRSRRLTVRQCEACERCEAFCAQLQARDFREPSAVDYTQSGSTKDIVCREYQLHHLLNNSRQARKLFARSATVPRRAQKTVRTSPVLLWRRTTPELKHHTMALLTKCATSPQH